jgi:hypothetical protein
MKRPVVVAAAVVSGLWCLSSLAVAAPSPITQPTSSNFGTPTCLIVNGGAPGTATKATACAQVQQTSLSVGYGKYLAPMSTDAVTATVVLQANVNRSTPGSFITLATTTTNGVGQIEATTRPLTVPASWTLRACVTAGVRGAQPAAHVCSGVG